MCSVVLIVKKLVRFKKATGCKFGVYRDMLRPLNWGQTEAWKDPSGHRHVLTERGLGERKTHYDPEAQIGWQVNFSTWTQYYL